MKSFICRFKVLLLCCLLFGLVGCVPAAFVTGAAAGAGTYVYVEGISRAEYPIHFDRMWTETRIMLEDQQVGIVEQSRTEGKGTIKGRTVDGRDVNVDLEVRGPEHTRVDIRVGLVPPDRQAADDLQRALARRVNVTLQI